MSQLFPKSGVIKGRVWKFGDNVNTTDITPQEMFGHGRQVTPKEMAFAALRPGWKDLVKPGDCIVAGDNFGQGSVRALAVDVMKDLRIGCIVANSIARLYFRQAIANGIPAFPCRGVANVFGEGDELEFNIHTGLVKNLSTLQSLQGRMYPPEILTILEAGGMMPLIVAKCRELVGMPQ